MFARSVKYTHILSQLSIRFNFYFLRFIRYIWYFRRRNSQLSGLLNIISTLSQIFLRHISIFSSLSDIIHIFSALCQMFLTRHLWRSSVQKRAVFFSWSLASQERYMRLIFATFCFAGANEVFLSFVLTSAPSFQTNARAETRTSSARPSVRARQTRADFNSLWEDFYSLSLAKEHSLHENTEYRDKNRMIQYFFPTCALSICYICSVDLQ